MRNLNDHSNYGIWNVCTQIYIAMCNLNCAIQITHHDVNLCTHGSKYCHSDSHLKCAIQSMHRDVNLHTHGPKYRHSDDH